MAKKTGNPGASARDTAPAEPIAAGVFAFEGDWDSDLRKQWSIDTMLDAVRGFGEIKYIHRDIGTVPELEYYVNKWLQRRYDAYQVGYFGFHGDPGNLWLDGKRHVSLEDLERMINGRAKGRVIHFGSCSVMRARDDRLRTFRRTPERAPSSATAGPSTATSSWLRSSSSCSKRSAGTARQVPQPGTSETTTSPSATSSASSTSTEAEARIDR